MDEETRAKISKEVKLNGFAPGADVDKVINASTEIGRDVVERVQALGEYGHSYNWNKDDEDPDKLNKQQPWEYSKPWTAEEKTMLWSFLIETFAEEARNTRNRPEVDVDG